MAQIRAIDIPAPHGLLEGLLRTPDDSGTHLNMAALVCHPDPMGGGTMHNKVVFRVAQALGDIGMPVLRFNFRGVGRSTGTHDYGRGEADDVRSALSELGMLFPDAALLVAGFSFGSWVGLPVGCADERVVRLLGVGVPVGVLDLSALEQCTKPRLFIQGELDEYGNAEAITSWVATLPEPKRLVIIPGADHFFARQQDELRAAVATTLRAELGVGGAD